MSGRTRPSTRRQTEQSKRNKEIQVRKKKENNKTKNKEKREKNRIDDKEIDIEKETQTNRKERERVGTIEGTGQLMSTESREPKDCEDNKDSENKEEIGKIDQSMILNSGKFEVTNNSTDTESEEIESSDESETEKEQNERNRKEKSNVRKKKRKLKMREKARERKEKSNTMPENYKKNKGRILLDEDGTELRRRLGLTDDEVRARTKESITQKQKKHEIKRDVLQVNYACSQDKTGSNQDNSRSKWGKLELGPAYISKKAIENLFPAVKAAMTLGIGTTILKGGRGYITDANGTKFKLRLRGCQILFRARIFNSIGEYDEIEFVHDSGCAVNVLRERDSKRWEEYGGKSIILEVIQAVWKKLLEGTH